MKADTTLTITPALVEEWAEKATQLETEAAQKVEEAKLLRARVEAATLLLGPVDVPHTPLGADDDAHVGNMIDAMGTIANTCDKPLTKSAMRSRLLTLGFPEDRMGNYFYTCVARLKAKKRITVLPDGRIWRAPT